MVHRCALRLAVAGSVALGLVLLWILSSRSEATSTVELQEQSPSEETLPSTGEMNRAPADTPKRSSAIEAREVVGRLVWSDGVPVSGARIALVEGAATTVCQDDGVFRLGIEARHASAITLAVHPGCWCTPATLVPALQQQAASPDSVREYVLPAEMDVRLSLSVDETSMALLHRAGYDAIEGRLFTRDRPHTNVRNEISAFFEQRTVLASVELPISRLPASRVMRVPIAEVIEGCAMMIPPSAREAMGAVATATKRVVTDRRFVPEIDLHIEGRGLIAGRVVDQDGQPLAGSKVAVPRLESNVIGPRRIIAGDNGWFIASGAPGDTHLVWAYHEVAESDHVQVPVGTLDLVLRCPTAGLRRIVVKSGAEPLQRFALTPNSSLFGKYDWPWLPLRTNGVAWLQMKQEPEPRYLCWHDGTRYQEVPIMVPGVRDAPMFEIDVSQLAPEPRGVLFVEHVPDGPAVRLRRVHPEPPTGFRPLGCGALRSNDGPLLGIPAGTYEIRVGTNPADPPVAKALMELVAGENRLRVADLLRAR